MIVKAIRINKSQMLAFLIQVWIHMKVIFFMKNLQLK